MKFSLVSLFALAASSASAGRIGKATYFYQNGNPGYCGAWNTDDMYFIAAAPDAGTQCGQQVHITNIGGGINNFGVGNSITATVVDRCPANECNANHLDLSVAAFKALAGGLDPPGAIQIKWFIL